MIIFWPFWRGVILYDVWGDGREGVYVVVIVECDLLCGPVVVVDYEDGGCVGVFHGCHSSPVDGFHGCVVVCKVC